MQLLLDELVAKRGFRPKILVVDDQAINIRLIHELFKNEYDVIMATDGEQAILKCETQDPDLILLDILMPGITGHDVCRRLKADSRTCDIPIIFLSAQDDEADQTLGFDLGAVDFITKPISGALVRARVRSHLALKLHSDLFKSIALADGLTGIANRRRFDESLQRDWLQCVRNCQYISLLMIDVDYFKRYNDHYGHLQGDDCLRKIASAINGVLKRPYDLAARYGGEEFACLLPNTDAAGAFIIARNIIDNVHALNIEHVQSEARQTITVSIGIGTQIAKRDRPASDLVMVADEQLYNAKRQGRDRVSSIDQDETGES